MSNSLDAQPATSKFREYIKRPYVRHIFFIWLVVTILIELFGPVQARIMGAPASESMKAIEDTMSLLTYTAAPVAALVIAVVLYSIFGWRRGAGGPSILNVQPAGGQSD